eukprot:TRINITY_DN27690_c0_g1_i1.p3 TRINITY_DN27690_c0_g1~~TRINITY_DN27690_c0_g1_i1.p3  ORF type:complete len:169 (+),score=61.24 TRINITY_DN27690_c0_g1_i1:58-507(+)
MAPAVFCWPELCFAVGSFLGEAEGVRTATVNRPWARSVRLLLLRQRGRLAAEVEAVAARLAAEPKSEGGHWGAVLRTARAALTARCAAAQLQLQIARVDIRIAALAPGVPGGERQRLRRTLAAAASGLAAAEEQVAELDAIEAIRQAAW